MQHIIKQTRSLCAHILDLNFCVVAKTSEGRVIHIDFRRRIVKVVVDIRVLVCLLQGGAGAVSAIL